MKLGNINITLDRTRKSANTSLLTIASGAPFNVPMLFNRWDDPQTNMLYIRETVSAAMHARSEAIGKGRFHAYEYIRSDGRSKRELAFDHPLTALLRAPNPLFDLTDLLELSSQWLDATGNALLLKVRNGFGAVSELWLLPATSFSIEKGSDELPATYLFAPMNARIAASDIIHIKRSDIRTAPFYGHALLSDIIETAKTDTALRCYQQRFFDNDAVPRAMLRFPAGTILTQDQIDSIRNAWEEKYRGVANANKLAILPDGAMIESLATNAKELDFTKSHTALRDTIREAFRVPKIVLGDTNDVNLSNAETSYTVFLRDVVDYALGKFSRALTKQLAAEFSANYVIEHDDIIPQSEERQLKRLELLKDALTREEQRRLLGFGAMKNVQ